MSLNLQNEIPVYERPHGLYLQEDGEVDMQIESWLSSGIIRTSHPDYASPVELYKKKLLQNESV